MAQKYRIYINDSILFITSKPIKSDENAQYIDYQNFDFLTFYAKLDKSITKNYIIVCPHVKKLFQKIKQQCNTIKAGGGLVRNLSGEILVIFRNRKWDLPKGKLEKGEMIKETAVREVEEECGVKIAKRRKLICKTYHVYVHHHEVCLKQTNWYAMDVIKSQDLVPQIEEGIEKVLWMDPANLSDVVLNTYPSIIRVLKKSKLIDPSLEKL